MKLQELMIYPGTLDTAAKDLVRDTAVLAHLAYHNSPDLILETLRSEPKYKKLFLKIAGSPEFVECADCDAQAFIFNYKRSNDEKPTMIVDVRGTTSLMDWLCNVSTYQSTFVDINCSALSNVKVHAGFYRQFKGLFSIFGGKIKEHLDTGGILICVGHSLGAAVACVAALYFGMGYKNQVGYVGFGGPRCGNDEFASTFDEHVSFYYRCKNASDPVPACIPPLAYSHVGYELHLGPEDFIPDVPVLIDVLDHSMARYLQALEKPEEAVSATPEPTSNWVLRTLSKFKFDFW